jgi:hypothetical protein
MIQSKTNPNQYFFGLIPEDFKDEGANGDQYYFSIDVDDGGGGEGSFYIRDNSARYLPFDFSQLPELVVALTSLLMAVDNAQSNK